MTAEEILRKHTRAILSGANLTKANALKAMEEYASLKVNEVKDQWEEKLQKCYTEIWKDMKYPLSMQGEQKADDILKKEFPFLT